MGTASEILFQTGLMDWNVLYIGLSKGWVTRSDIINFAVQRMVEGESGVDISILASAEMSDDEELCTTLKKKSSSENFDHALEVWRLAHLKEIEFSNLDDEEKVNKLQEVYANFDYPHDMRSCSIYSGTNTPPLIEMKRVIEALEGKIGNG